MIFIQMPLSVATVCMQIFTEKIMEWRLRHLEFKAFYLFFLDRIDFISSFKPTIPPKEPLIYLVRRESLFNVKLFMGECQRKET